MNYYTILDVQRKASAADIRAGYHRQTRIWRIRAASSNTNVSEKAVKRLSKIKQAFMVLSNAQQRATYDRRPLAAIASALPGATSSGALHGDSLQRADYYLEQGDCSAPAGAAREAHSDQTDSAEARPTRACAHAGQDCIDDAVYESLRALELAPLDPWKHADSGFTYEHAGMWNDALQKFQQAAALDATEPLFQLAIGGILADHGQPQQALPIIERVYRADSDDETACYYYTRVLLLMAEAVPQEKSDDGYFVTSAAEIQRMRGYLERGSAVKYLDQEMRQTIQEIETYLQKVEEHTLSIPIPFSAWRAVGATAE